MNDLIVFSHLRWGFVFQRPQHILSRLAKNRKILFVEEPVDSDFLSKNVINESTKPDNLTILQPNISWENMIDELTPLVKDKVKELGMENPDIWFYGPSFVEMADRIDHNLVIFDCMDQLTAFKGAPPALLDQEKHLLETADIVFTGGKSLYEEKKKFTSNVYCFPSSVERAHFEKALAEDTEIPEDSTNIKRPIVGFFGVIDERIDLELLDQTSKALPNVSFVIIGPVVKIDESELPRNPNLHYLGGKDYKNLPNYLKAMDIAMMPFGINMHTQFISPTKTLEYMAAMKPIISTPIYDVIRDYSDVVSIVKTNEEFVAAINKYLNESDEDKKIRETAFSKILDNTSWDKTAEKMSQIMEEFKK